MNICGGDSSKNHFNISDICKLLLNRLLFLDVYEYARSKYKLFTFKESARVERSANRSDI